MIRLLSSLSYLVLLRIVLREDIDLKADLACVLLLLGLVIQLECVDPESVGVLKLYLKCLVLLLMLFHQVAIEVFLGDIHGSLCKAGVLHGFSDVQHGLPDHVI